ncbi:hypothetical protein INQ51_10425 [Maribellus sp. CM-23]|uniref:inositol polyphosphate kinase family protein n=1 Tax=Maribellus sp. CM-23 TaxID=2781026 RepID=UPI001F218906|nr:inositol polyphosphate kinase family protein [Maribellus sp. CM-23]MCE4564726.1 hypothetical protein [Maribellus sp. CM-23]
MSTYTMIPPGKKNSASFPGQALTKDTQKSETLIADNRPEVQLQRQIGTMAGNHAKSGYAVQLKRMTQNTVQPQVDATSENPALHPVQVQKKPFSQKPKRVVQSNSNTIQRAGHEEDLCFVGRWLVKRADSTEIAQYRSGETPAIAPDFNGPFYTAEEALQFLLADGENPGQEKMDKINLMAQTMSEGGKGFMMLANATTGMANPKMRDLKMGKHTASGTDQERHGVKGLAKVAKIVRHDAMDYWSGSSKMGFRDEDRWKLSKTGDNTDELQQMLDRSGKPTLAQIYRDLDTFRNWLDTTDVVYVGMSLLIVSGENSGKAVAIDFEHPIRRDDRSFEEHRDGIILGVDNIKRLVEEYYNNFEERAMAREAERKRRAEEDREKRKKMVNERGGVMSGTGEGNLSIGNEDL